MLLYWCRSCISTMLKVFGDPVTKTKLVKTPANIYLAFKNITNSIFSITVGFSSPTPPLITVVGASNKRLNIPPSLTLLLNSDSSVSSSGTNVDGGLEPSATMNYGYETMHSLYLHGVSLVPCTHSRGVLSAGSYNRLMGLFPSLVEGTP